jgi:hypothetical protein
MVWGVPGSGKSLCAEVLQTVYGENWAEVDQEVIQGTFNYWVARKSFILGSEISATDRRAHHNMIKNLITRATVHVNIKKVPQHVLRDCANYWLVSNDPDALYLKDDDRRTWVHHAEQVLDPDRGVVIAAWARTPEGAGAIRYFLENFDLAGFNPKGKPPVTDAKKAMIDAGRSDLDGWCKDIMAGPDGILSLGSSTEVPDLWSLPDLAAIYKQTHDRTVSSNKALSKSLEGAGAFKTERAHTKRGRINLFAVKDIPRWRGATLAEISTEYDKTIKQQKFC